TYIECITPANAEGSYDVTIINSDNSTGVWGGQFSYVPLTVHSIYPEFGLPTGGTPVTIEANGVAGFGTTGTPTITFGANPATDVQVSAGGSIIQVTCNAPAGALGTVDVTVTNPNNDSFVLPNA